MRWLLLDEVVAIEKKAQAKAASHIPADVTLSPQLALIEMMAQTGALLLGAESDFEQDLVFAKIESADFSEGCEPGQPVEIRATSENLRTDGAWLDGSVTCGDRRIASSRFLLMNVGSLRDDGNPVTFHEAFMRHFKIRDKVK